MPRHLGPFDSRLKTKRCLNCIKAHAKCDGKLPCSQCFFADRVCTPADAHSRKIQLKPSSQGNIIRPCTLLLSRPSIPWTDRCISHLFSSSLRKHDLTGCGRDVYGEVHGLVTQSECLQNVVLAISSLDIEVYQSVDSKPCLKRALTYYQNSVVSLRERLLALSAGSEVNNEVLWTTLFLSIFELMYSTSGDGFLCHFVRGTTELLKTKDPCQYLQNGGSSFFYLARMFEMIRALVFWRTPAFQNDKWQEAVDLCSSEDATSTSDSQQSMSEELYRLIGKTTKLADDTMNIVQNRRAQDLSEDEVDSLIKYAAEGLRIRQALEMWHSRLQRPGAVTSLKDVGGAHRGSTNEHEHSSKNLTCNNSHTSTVHKTTGFRIAPQLLLSQIYYHTISVNLSSIFSHNDHFPRLDIAIPSLPRATIRAHVASMLVLIETALKHTTLAGPLLLWPIRATGARASSKDQVRRVQAILEEVQRRGFIVAKSFQKLCMQQWWIPRGFV